MTTTQYPNSPKASYATEDIGIDNIRSSKFNLVAVTAVLALHGLVSWSLANMDVVTRPIKPITSKPPIEVEMVILPDVEAPVELKEAEDLPLKPIDKPVGPAKAEIKPTPPQPRLESKPDPKPKPVNKAVQKPIDKPKPAPVKKTPPPVSKAPERPVEHNPTEDKVVEKVVETPAKSPTPFSKTLTVNESKTVIQQQQDTERLAQEKAAQEQAARDKLAKEKAAQEKAATDAKAAASNEPVSISAGQAAASWKRKPNFSSLSRLKLGLKEDTVFNVVINLKVDKQGNIANATIAQSSGNSKVDKAFLRAVKGGNFHPFIVDGVPRVGNAALPLTFKVEAR